MLIDGILTDWTTTDRLELPGSDVMGYALYGRYESGLYYFALSAPVAIGTNTTFWLNTDQNLSTGYKVWGWATGAENNINFDAAGVPHLYTGADGATFLSDVEYGYNTARTAVEFSIPSTALGNTQALNVYVDVNNQVFLPTNYADYAYTVAASTPTSVVVGNATLDGSLSEWTAADRIDTSLGVAGYEIYGRVTGDNYVIALKSATQIGTNTTAWLNTDLNALTGHQIWGFTGGAEYNVNFNASGNAVLYTGGAGETAVANGDILERFSADKTIVEFAIPKELLGFTGTPGAIYTLYDINDSVFLSTSYATTQYTIAPSTTAPVVGAMTLDGALGDWTAANRIDGVAAVAGYEVYGRTSGDSYVYAIKAPAGTSIGANTTLWLNTDQNVGTGFDIFPGGAVEGGAEYNINFDANGVPGLYTGAAGGTPVPGAQVLFGRSSDGSTVELAVAKSAIGSPAGINTLIDVNNETFLPASYSGPAYSVLDVTGLPPRTDFSKKVAIVYSETTAARYFGNADVNINETGYAQLFMAAQNQAAMAGVPFDLLSESDLTNLANLVNYDAIVFPSFQFVNSADVAMITNNLTLLAQNYNTSFIAAGNFMTADQSGALLAGDPYANMKTLFDVQPQAGGFAGTTSVEISSAGAGFGGVGGYAANETIHTYSNPAGVGWLAFSDATTGTTPLTVIDNQTVIDGTGAGIYAAVVTSSINGDRNVHFSTEALLGDNNQLWQAIQYAVNGSTGPTVGLQMGRQSSIVASRNDMDQSKYADEVDPANNAAGIYDQLLPILQQWKDAYNFVGSYYINVGDNPGGNEQTNWSVSLPYYQQMIAWGNEIGSHSLTHLEALTPVSNDTNVLTTGTGPGTFDYEFRSSRDIIQANIAAGVPGYQIAGAAVPGAPERAATAKEIIQYYDYLSGGYASVGAGYPGAFGYLSPAYEDLGKVYLAPNATFDFTLNEFRGMMPAQADEFWAQEWASLTAHTDLPIVVWPWHDYGPTEWQLDPPSASPYDISQFTNYIARAANAGAEFVTLADLAQRIESFEKAAVTSTVAGNVVTATVSSTDAGKFALDLDNLGTQVIKSVAGWYAYDADSVFTQQSGGSYTITLGTAADDVTHITALPMRSDLISVTGDGTGLSFTLIGEGRVVVDLKNPAGAPVAVSGATVVSQVGDILTLDLGAIGSHMVAITPENVAPLITSNGGGATAAIPIAENGTAVTTVVATDGNLNQTLTYLIDGGADAALFDLNPTSGVLTFKTAPDFEIPKDNGANNVYDVVVKVVDSGTPVASDTQALAITVTDVIGLNYNGTTAADVVSGTSEADTLNGNGGNDTLSGLAGNDTLNGGAGADTMIGGGGNDTYVVDNAGDVVDETGGDGIDTVQSSVTFSLADALHAKGSIENLTLTGSAAINGTGNALANTIIGNSGNNVLAGLVGADFLDGGAGSDTATYVASGTGVNVSLMTGMNSGGDAEADTLLNIENLTGSALDDTLEGNAGNNVLAGGANGSVGDTVSYANASNPNSGAGVLVNLAITSAQNTVIAGMDTLTGFENVIGSAFDDTLTGTSANNVLTGGGGNDILNGNGGNDMLLGLAGNDTVNGGVGADTMIGGGGNDTYVVDNAGDVVDETGGDGIDTVQSSVTFSLADALHAKGSIENLTLTGSAAINGTGNALANTIIGNSGNNVLAGLVGADFLDGGAGSDTATYVASGTGVNVSLMTGMNSGGDAEADTLLNIENLTGSALDDTLEGNAGNNVLAGGANGSVGDTVSYANASNPNSGAGVLVNLAITSAQNTVIAGMDTLTGFENVIGSAFDDTLTGTSANNVLTGGGGNDILNGNGGNDMLLGLAGNDTVNGGVGADTMIGGGGNDTYVVDNAGDVVDETGGDGIDTVQSSVTFSLADALHAKGSIENLTLTGSAAINGTGNALANTIIGNSGNNVLAGLVGADFLDGGAGSDTATYVASGTGVNVSLMTGMNSGGDAEADTLLNIENLTGSALDDTLEGNAGNNVLAGGANGSVGDTVSYANASNPNSGAGVLVNLAITSAQNTVIAGMDTLTGFENVIGSAFDDTLTGTSANNVLTGGGGNDILTGGAGADTFVFNPDFGTDVITDFNPSQDVIRFSPALFANYSAAVTSGAIQPAGANNTVITYDANDTVTLTNVAADSLSATNFKVA